MKTKISKDSYDISAMYMCYISTCGDCERVGLAMDISPEVVRDIADREGWLQKIRKVSCMSKSEKAGDFERATNRCLNFLAAHQLRGVIQKIIDVMSHQEGNELLANLGTTKAGQLTMSARFVTDLSKALETVSHISYVALSDSVPEREVKSDGEEEMNLQGLHAAVLGALSHNFGAGAERKLLEDTVEGVVRDNVPPKPPEDKP